MYIYFFMLYELYVYKCMKNIFLLILGKADKMGGGEKLSDVRKPGVLYPSSLFWIFSPALPACGRGRAYPGQYRCADRHQRCGRGQRAGVEYSCPGQRGRWWKPPASAEVAAMFT